MALPERNGNPALSISRRRFLGRSLATAAALSASGTVAGLAHAEGDAGKAPADAPRGRSMPPRPSAVAPPGRRVEKTFRLARAELSPAQAPTPAMLVNGEVPGPELRLREGDWLRVTVANDLDMPATIHWHGILLPSAMDGVPEVTQAPIPPRGYFVYEYPIRQRGTYWYHSHFQFQEQVGLAGPLVIEGSGDRYAYDRDEVLFLSDWMNADPWGAIPRLRAEATKAMAMPGGADDPKATAMGATADGPTPSTPAAAMAGMKMGGGTGDYDYPPGKPFETDVPYDAYLLNGRPPSNPWRCKARRGERIRFRIINGSGSTFFRFAIDGHRLEVVECDGQPVEPVVVDDLVIGTGETYDVLVTVAASGAHAIHAAALGDDRQAFGVLHTPGAKDTVPMERPAFAGRSLIYADLRAAEPTTLRKGTEKQIQLSLGGDMTRYLWSMGGQYYPSPYVPDGRADPLPISLGDRVTVELVNETSMFHPMHLHGHFFRLLVEGGDAARSPLKHTVAVAPGERLRFEFLADNPGRWFFHCHNAYHLEAGMARVVEYVVT